MPGFPNEDVRYANVNAYPQSSCVAGAVVSAGGDPQGTVWVCLETALPQPCSTCPFTPPLFHSDCQPHPSPPGNSTHLLSITLAQYIDCSPHIHCQSVFSLLLLCFFGLFSCSQTYLSLTNQPLQNPGNYLSLLSPPTSSSLVCLGSVCLFLALH